MKALKKKTKILVIVAAVLVVLFLVAIVLFLPGLIQPALWALLFLGLGFFAVEFFARMRKKKKQKNFDEQLAAKEGIEDRKREWGGWIEELERQGIDRYELPFYMIVGEPQSGKSVLLQNSDLYFPFGQDRLSGVGGTRGCDWWFTDEAVILDIAGRLFTHEGGVADKLEWEAFLDMLSAFRPLCPANGVLLVVPCDALMQDSPETCADKANKIQSALLTLTQKLEAKLPVYLVLTKGDKIFGFAESVHRLDAESRHQMFGWSRPAEDEEQPFELAEARAGFAEIVERAQLLRERMIASARLPEALPEVDRMYAFPEELAGMYDALEIYLKRVFSETNLVERMSFRGIYLSSGLQSGVPIARVCADLIGESGESDARGLESLFSHQRAYFIKDLVRDRVFRERGLVRPTEGRVTSARRHARLGYGAAAVIAVASIVGASIHVASDRSDEVVATIEAALDAGRAAVDHSTIPELLQDLHAIRLAEGIDRDLMREVFQSTREGFEHLYDRVCEQSLLPALRVRIEETVRAAATSTPTSYRDVQRLIEDAMPLFGDLDLGSSDGRALAKRLVREDWSTTVNSPDGEPAEFSVADALADFDGDKVSTVDDRERLDVVATRIKELLDAALVPGSGWALQSQVGYMSCWQAADDAYLRIKPANERNTQPPAELLQLCDQFARAVGNLRQILRSGALTDGEISNLAFSDEEAELVQTWKRCTDFIERTPRAMADEQSVAESYGWARIVRIKRFAKQRFDENPNKQQLPSATPGTGIGALDRELIRRQQGFLAGKLSKIAVPDSNVRPWVDDTTGLVAACGAQPKESWTLAEVDGVLTGNLENYRSAPVYRKKIAVMADQLPDRYPGWADLAEEFHGAAPPADGTVDRELLGAVAALRRDLNAADLGEHPASRRLSALLVEHLETVAKAWDTAPGSMGTAVDWPTFRILSSLAAAREELGDSPADNADDLRWRYLNHHESKLLEDWRRSLENRKGRDETLRVADAVNVHFAALAEFENLDEGIELDHPDHLTWLGDLDGLLASRLGGHVASLEGHWRYDTSTWNTLEDAIRGIEGSLDKKLLRELGDDVPKLDAPPADAVELRVTKPVGNSDRLLPRTVKMAARLRAFRRPGVRDFERHPFAVQLSADLADAELQLGRDSGGGLAKLAAGTSALEAASETPSTVEFYLRPLHEQLHVRLVAEVRRRYLQELEAAVNLQGSTALLDALYAEPAGAFDADDAMRDGSIVSRLDKLLQPDGSLDTIRTRYQMAPPTEEAPRSLRPEKPITAADAERSWWAFEEFLTGLQAFFARTEAGRPRGATFKIALQRLESAGPRVWAEGGRSVFRLYYCADSHGRNRTVGESRYTDRWQALSTPIQWTIDREGKAKLWLVWTDRIAPGFDYPRDRDEGTSFWFEANGALTPLLLAWAGRRSADEWEIEIQPTRAPGTAGFSLSFVNDEDLPIPLPTRPARPETL
jgi:hypothetical protein